MMKRKLVGILSAVLALGGILAACAPDEPTAQEGTVYLTEIASKNIDCN